MNMQRDPWPVLVPFSGGTICTPTKPSPATNCSATTHGDPWPDLEPVPRQRTADECLFHWSTVCRVAKEEWAKSFAFSVLKQSRRRGWQPTPKQLTFMRRMVSDLFVYRADDDDLPLIE